jgi:hypothetical protein
MSSNDDLHPIQKLGRKPRELEVICTKDGNSFSWKDDGGALTRDGLIAHPFRQSFIRKMALKNDDKRTPTYVLKSRPGSLYDGDPFAGFPVLDASIQAVIDENVKVRSEKLKSERLQLVNEAKSRGASDFVQKAVEGAVEVAIAAERAKKVAAKA